MDEQTDDDEVVDVAVCPKCSIMTEHTILKKAAKGKGEDLLVRCQECSEVHLLTLRPSTLAKVRVTLSHGSDSKSVLLESDSDEIISIGDLFQFEESHLSLIHI